MLGTGLEQALEPAVDADLVTEPYHVGVVVEHVDLLVDDSITRRLVWIGYELGKGVGKIFAWIGC